MLLSPAFAAGVLISTALFVMIHACKETECDVHTTGWVGMIGLGLESALDGIAIAVGYFTHEALGLIIAFAVAVHELPVGFSTSIIMMRSHYDRKNTLLALFVTLFLTVLWKEYSGYRGKV